MLTNSVQKMPSIQRRISIEFRNHAHRLSANSLSSYLWRYIYLPSVHFCLHVKLTISFSVSFAKRNSSPLHVFTSKAFMQLMSALRQFWKHFSPASVYSLMYVL